MTQLWTIRCEGKLLGVLSKMYFPDGRVTGGETPPFVSLWLKAGKWILGGCDA